MFLWLVSSKTLRVFFFFNFERERVIFLNLTLLLTSEAFSFMAYLDVFFYHKIFAILYSIM